MTTKDKLARRKLSLLELAQELSNVSRACKVMGYSRQQFYEIRRNFQTYGAEGLINRLPGARGPHPNRVSEEIEKAVLETANAAQHGLAASVFTRDLKKAHRFSDALRTGIINVNAPSRFWELHIPFGGVAGKCSSIGRLGGQITMREMTDVKTVIFDLN